MPDDGLGEGGLEQKCQGGPSPYFFILEKFYLLNFFFFWAQGGLWPPLPCTWVRPWLHDPLLLGVTTNRPFPNEKLFMEAVNPLIYLTATGNQAPDAHQTTQLNQILQNDILGNCHLIFFIFGSDFLL